VFNFIQHYGRLFTFLIEIFFVLVMERLDIINRACEKYSSDFAVKTIEKHRRYHYTAPHADIGATVIIRVGAGVAVIGGLAIYYIASATGRDNIEIVASDPNETIKL
jgi:hypothetical protein